jgi:hypothetical protein
VEESSRGLRKIDRVRFDSMSGEPRLGNWRVVGNKGSPHFVLRGVHQSLILSDSDQYCM